MWFYFYIIILFLLTLALNRKMGLSYPINFVTFILLFYFPFKYLCYRFSDIPPLHELTLKDLSQSGLYLSIFFTICYSTIYLLQFSKLYIPLPKFSVKERIPFGIFSYLSIFLILITLVIFKGPSILTRPLEVRIIMTSQGMYYFTIIFQFLTTYYSLKLIEQREYKKLIIFSVIFAIFSFISGRAALQAYFLLNILLFLGVYFHRPIYKYLLLTIPLILIYTIITGIHRVATFHSSMTWGEVSQSLNFVSENRTMLFKFVLEKLLYRFDQLDQLSLLIKSLSNSELSYSFGQHMVEVLLQAVPRFFWEDKPLNFTAFMTNFFHPEVYLEGHGNNFTGIGELLYNFGLIGLILGAIFFGFLIYLSSLFWKKGQKSFLYSFLIIFFWLPYLSTGILAGFFNDLALPNLIFSSIILIIFCRIYIFKTKGNYGVS